MSWKVDPKSLLFTDLDMNEEVDLFQLVQKIHYSSFIDLNHPAVVSWKEQACYRLDPLADNDRMVAMRDTFCIRALISVVNADYP